jgi:NADPH:quinone reductase-like Zn-dependent oxidoreductase
MRAYQLPKGGAGIEALVLIERPDPKPGHRQVLVQVKACALNFRDLGIVRGTYRMPVADNIIPLSDGAGEVVAIGPDVKRVKVGDRVAGCFFQRWPGGEATADVHASALGGGIDGMLAEYVVLEEDGVVNIPPHLSLEEGATLPCAGVTVWHAMMEHAKLVAGQIVLLQGTGGVSVFGLQFARAMGIQAIITSSSDEKLERAKALGANHGINYKTIPDWDKAAMAFTDGVGVDRRGRSRRRVDTGALVWCHPCRRQDHHDRRLGRRRDRAQSRLDLQSARQCTRYFGRLDADVHSDGARDHRERHQAGDRSGLSVRRHTRRLQTHGVGTAFRQNRYPRGVARASRPRSQGPTLPRSFFFHENFDVNDI